MRFITMFLGVLVLAALTGCYHEDRWMHSAIGGDTHVRIDHVPFNTNVVEHTNSLPAEVRCRINSGQAPNPWQQQNCAMQSSGGQGMAGYGGYMPGMMPGMPYGQMMYGPPAAYPVH